MIDKKLEAAFNEQINKEFYSEYLQLAMKIKFMEWNLQGFVNWFGVQVQEEHAHGMGFFNYLDERGGQIELSSIAKPEFKGTTPLEIFEEVLAHEQYVTSSINHVADIAEEIKDRAALHLLDWYIKEQVEEEANVGGLLATLRLIGDDKKALLMLDKDLAARTFVQPVIGQG